MGRGTIGSVGARTARHGDDAVDAELGRQPDRAPQVRVVPARHVGIGMEWVAGHVQGGDAEAGVVDRLAPACESARVPDELRGWAVRRRRVASDPDLQVLDQAGAGRPVDDLSETTVWHGIGEQANTQCDIGAFQIPPQSLSVSSYGVVLDQLLVELEAKSGTVR